MKYLSQFLLIMAFSLLGEVLQRMIPLPIPASVYGIVLLFLCLCFGIVKPEQVKGAAGFLSSLLPLLFVAPSVSILENWALIRDALIPMVLLILISTVLTFCISGRITQNVMEKGEKKQDEAV